MPVSDPIADMLAGPQRQYGDARHREDAVVQAQGSPRQDPRARGLHPGFNITDNTDAPGKTLEIELKYSVERARTISGIKRVSKPGLRVYSAADRLPRVLGGLGVAVLSTSQGS